jgi:hypothetical protein
MDFNIATFQTKICTRIRFSNLVTEQLSPSNGSNGMQNITYKNIPLLQWGVLQSRVVAPSRSVPDGKPVQPLKTAGTPILHVGFKTATFQTTICTRIR